MTSFLEYGYRISSSAEFSLDRSLSIPRWRSCHTCCFSSGVVSAGADLPVGQLVGSSDWVCWNLLWQYRVILFGRSDAIGGFVPTGTVFGAS